MQPRLSGEWRTTDGEGVAQVVFKDVVASGCPLPPLDADGTAALERRHEEAQPMLAERRAQERQCRKHGPDHE